jgi:monothiol glutaredoxin
VSELKEQIEQIIATEDVALFMKGTPQFAMCGNSQRALEALRRAGAPVTAVDILPDPQIFVRGELVGGADIVEELAQSGELEQMLEQKLGSEYRRAGEERVVPVP